MEKISIIIPVYNVEEYLEECIKSIIKQTYTNLEIILIDDGSTDESGKICDEYKKKDNRITVIHQQNQGISVARNVGIELSKGEYIQFVDSDDFIKTNMVEDLYNIIKKEDVDLVSCSHYIYTNGNVQEKEYSEKIEVYTQSEAIKSLILDKSIRFFAVDKLYKKELWQNVRFPIGRRFEDIATTPKIFKKVQKIAFYDKPLYYYRQREGSIMSKRSKEQQLEYIQSILEMQQELTNIVQDVQYYLNYNIVHATLNVFRSIGNYKIQELLQEQIVQHLYKKTVEIMENSKNVEFIIQHCNNAKKVHLYYLLTNATEYIKNIKYLPDIYSK